MMDLLYCETGGKEIEDLLKKPFPDAKTSVDWDDIHQERVAIELPDEKRREYLKFIIKEGLGNMSFIITLALMDKAGILKNPIKWEVEEIVKELNKEAEDANKSGGECNSSS